MYIRNVLLQPVGTFMLETNSPYIAHITCAYTYTRASDQGFTFYKPRYVYPRVDARSRRLLSAMIQRAAPRRKYEGGNSRNIPLQC